jgi:hypothetical protein
MQLEFAGTVHQGGRGLMPARAGAACAHQQMQQLQQERQGLAARCLLMQLLLRVLRGSTMNTLFVMHSSAR